jgi:hypothetical protein
LNILLPAWIIFSTLAHGICIHIINQSPLENRPDFVDVSEYCQLASLPYLFLEQQKSTFKRAFLLHHQAQSAGNRMIHAPVPKKSTTTITGT